jgi:hypothetical protein
MATATVVKEKRKRSDFLPNKVVVLMPVPRKGGMIDDPAHKAYFAFPDTVFRACLTFDSKKGSLIPILDEEELEFFKEEVGADNMSFYKLGKDNYWSKFHVDIKKTDYFMENGRIFDLSNPIDNLSVRVLKVHPLVCPTWEERYDKGDYRYALRDLGYVEEQRVKKADLNLQAYEFFAKIKESSEKMYNFLSVAFMQFNRGKRPSAEASRDTYRSLIQEMIETDVNGFLSISSDEYYEDKLMLYRALAANHVIKESFTKDFMMADSKTFLGHNVDEVVHNLRTPDYQDARMRLDALLNISAKK